MTAGLEWSGNESTNVRRMLYWSRPFPIYDATYVFRALPKGPKSGPNPTYWTMFFWGNNGVFWWDNYSANSYYGAHPYPTPAPYGSTQAWEISVYGNDYLGPTPSWNRWYTQVFRAWRESASLVRHEFIYDYELWISSGKTKGVMSKDIDDPVWAAVNPPSPCICVGQAPDFYGVGASSGQSWGGYAGYEEFKGVLSGMQFYNARLSDAQLASELATPGSARTPWYLNLNPTPSDTSDKSGNANHPLWDGSKAALWTK